MGIHPWWSGLGQAVASQDDLSSVPAREFVSAIATGAVPGVALTGLSECAKTGQTAVALEIEVERPQDLAYPVRATEPIAVVFAAQGGQPRVLTLRDDFPDTPHQNWTPQDAPCSLCVDDRPWSEARLTYRPSDFVRRIQLWLAKAARGELHDTAQPPDPLFFISQLAMIVPRSALRPAANPIELIGFVRPDNPAFIITRAIAETEPRRKGLPGFVVIEFRAQPQSMTRLRHAPVTLAALHAELQQAGIDLNEEIKTRLMAWAGIANDSVRRLSSRLAIVVAFPITTPDGKTTDDLRAFISLETAGQIGEKWGVLVNTKAAGVAGADDIFVRAVPESAPSLDHIKIEPAQVHLAFDRELAAAVAGHAVPDRRRAVLVGGGAVGSQIGMNMAREGAFSWTVVDSDYLLPHNLARHALLADELGAPKALALARQMGLLLNEPFTAVAGDVTKPDAELVRELAEADVILDASASVAVSRHLADLADSKGRRISVFFNPAGTAVVLLAEKSDRSITLRDLEAQYHRLVQNDRALEDHLRAGPGLRYSGSCRALTNRIPATSAALLSALGARGFVEALKSDDAAIRIWNVTEAGAVQLIEHRGAATHRLSLGDWSITYDDNILADLARHRDSRLPRETGGVLLGIVDMSRKSIHLAHALPEPEDSRGSPEGFERGVVGLKAAVSRAVETSLHQVSYVGEWHSHPRKSSPLPSSIDLAQIIWLGNELEHEGLPGLMAIAAADGAFAFVLAGPSARTHGEPLPSIRTGGGLMETGATTDLQRSFEARASSGHSLNAGKLEGKIGLALSGGGSRAIAFHLGCLRALNRLGLLDRVAVLSTVSGGSVIGAYFHAHQGDFPSFEAKIRGVLSRGLVKPMWGKFFGVLGVKIVAAFLVTGFVAACVVLIKLLVKCLNLIAPRWMSSHWEQLDIRSPLRFASRTTLLEAALDEVLFKGACLNDLPRQPHLVVNATELRTGSAFRFGTLESGSWRWGKLHRNAVSVAHAVAASAAYPLLLPAFDETLTFDKNGELKNDRVILTDGGIYDNLGLGCLWPDRSEKVSLNVIPVDTIICCSAGFGLRQEPPSQFILARMFSVFSTVFDRAQNASIHRLHEAKRSGQIRRFILPYLGQRDRELPNPPADLVRREEAHAYPTDFNAIPGEWIERLSLRGEQLTLCLAQAYIPELLSETSIGGT